MNKKEFKKKCKQDKTISYRLMLLGGIISTIGLIVVLLSFLFLKKFIPQIIGFIAGVVVAFTKMILDLTGEIILVKNYKEYNSNL